MTNLENKILESFKNEFNTEDKIVKLSDTLVFVTWLNGTTNSTQYYARIKNNRIVKKNGFVWRMEIY